MSALEILQAVAEASVALAVRDGQLAATTTVDLPLPPDLKSLIKEHRDELLRALRTWEGAITVVRTGCPLVVEDDAIGGCGMAFTRDRDSWVFPKYEGLPRMTLEELELASRLGPSSGSFACAVENPAGGRLVGVVWQERS